MAAAAPLDPLAWNDGIWFASYDHCVNMGTSGATGHTGQDGSDMTERMSRHGRASGSWAENIAYGNNDAIEIVMQLFIDDGVPSRGHRDN